MSAESALSAWPRYCSAGSLLSLQDRGSMISQILTEPKMLTQNLKLLGKWWQYVPTAGKAKSTGIQETFEMCSDCCGCVLFVC